MKNILGDIITGWTTYVLHPVLFYPNASDKVYQLLAHGQWFSPGTSASSTTKTGRHDITEILLKVALSTNILGDIITGWTTYVLHPVLFYPNLYYGGNCSTI
jgi:hypothetical protein